MKKIITLTLFLFCLAPLFAQSAEKELEFYKNEIITAEKKQLSALEWDLNSWLERNYSLPSAPEAMFYKAKVEYLNKQYTPAYLTLLKYAYEFPSKKFPKDLANQIVAEFPAKRQTELMQALTPKNLPQSTEDRLNMYFTAVNKLELKGANEHLLKDYSLFFARFPGYENKDKIELLLGDSYRNEGNYNAALSKYDKVWKIYPSTKYKAASLRMKGDIYASELKDLEKAKSYYNQVLKDYPNSVEIPTVYKHLAFLEANEKSYESAIEKAQKAYEGYLKDGQKLEAYNTLMFKAEVQEKNLKNYNAAVESLKTAAELMPAQEQYYVAAKQKEADIQGRKLKDNYAERNVLEEIAVRFPNTENGVNALYRSAEITEQLGEVAKAREKYQKVILNRPQSNTAVKAQKRITSVDKAIAKGKLKAEKAAQKVKESKEAAVKTALPEKPVKQITE
jgi:tetratricopeptide (TPR) repeat protein